MYDALTASYGFACPHRGEAHVALSSFRRVERLPGARHPALYRVTFACGCGEEHLGLVAHDDLDWAPLGGAGQDAFLNLMTARLDPVADELLQSALRRLAAGEWPWSFFCYPEERPRPVFPSAFKLLAPAASGDRVGLLVRCPACGRVSINLVSRAHLDLPFHNDQEVGVVAHVFAEDRDATVEAFAAELSSSRFDARRLELD